MSPETALKNLLVMATYLDLSRLEATCRNSITPPRLHACAVDFVDGLQALRRTLKQWARGDRTAIRVRISNVYLE